MRERLLEAAERLVQERGLLAVSFQQLADAVGLSKPSVFHHFASKQELAAALVERCRTKHGPAHAAIIDSDASAPDKLRGIAEVFERELRDDRLCLLSSLGQSAPALSAAVRDDLRASAEGSIQTFSRVFAQGDREGSLRFEGDAADAAAAFLALLEGLQVLARARGDHEVFRRAAGSYIDSLSPGPIG